MNEFIPSIEPLPGPGVVARTLFEQPWPAVAALLIIGGLAAIVLLRRGRLAPALATGGIGTALAGAVVLSAALVTTDHERLMNGTRALAVGAVAGDVDAVGDLLAPDARLLIDGAPGVEVDREALLRAVGALDRRAGVRGHGVLDRTASIDGPNAARSRVVVRVDFEGVGPAFSSWQIGWRLEPDGVWRITRLEPLSINGRAPGAWLASEITGLGR